MAGPGRENCFSVLSSTLRAQKAQSLPPADKASAWRWKILTELKEGIRDYPLIIGY